MDDGNRGDDYFQVTADLGVVPITVAASGELDAGSSGELGRSIDAALAVGVDVVLDLGQVTFMDSSGLRVIMVALRRARDEGLIVRVSSTSPAVRRIFEITGVTSLLCE